MSNRLPPGMPWVRSFMLVALAVSGTTFAAGERPLIRLSEGGFGAGGARSWELRLERDGRVVEEWWNVYSTDIEGLHRETTLRTIPASEIEAVMASASALTRSLPEYIDDDGKILVDEETRAIHLATPIGERFSGWAGFQRKPATRSSRRFMHAWQALADLMSGRVASSSAQKP